MKWLGNFYQWFWFHTEFWSTPRDRRPYTFIMRDWIYKHMAWFIVMLISWYTALILINKYWNGMVALILGIFSSLLVAHLMWGAGWIEKQQEVPEYLG